MAARFGLAVGIVRLALDRLAERGRVVEGDFLPGGPRASGATWRSCGRSSGGRSRSCGARSSRSSRPRSRAFSRSGRAWRGRAPGSRRSSPPSSSSRAPRSRPPRSRRRSCPRASSGIDPADLDFLLASGEIVWRGLEPLGPSDGRIALYLTDRAPLLAPRPAPAEGELAARVRELLRRARRALLPRPRGRDGRLRGRSRRGALGPGLGGRGLQRHARAAALDAARLVGEGRPPRAGRPSARVGSARREAKGAGRSCPDRRPPAPTETERRAALVRVAARAARRRDARGGRRRRGRRRLHRRLPVLKAMEDAGQVRRGYFVAGLGATQFALPGADDRLRGQREAPESEESRTLVLAATDPANPWGAALAWPASAGRSASAAGGGSSGRPSGRRASRLDRPRGNEPPDVSSGR